jgi:hypothetical protein
MIHMKGDVTVLGPNLAKKRHRIVAGRRMMGRARHFGGSSWLTYLYRQCMPVVDEELRRGMGCLPVVIRKCPLSNGDFSNQNVSKSDQRCVFGSHWLPVGFLFFVLVTW